MNETLIVVVSVVCAVGLPVITGLILGYQSMRNRHEQRMNMIDKGIILEEPERKANRYPALRNGLVMIGLALGILFGILMYPAFPNMDGWEELIIPMMAILFGGIAFIIYFFLSYKMQKKERRENELKE